MLCYAMLCYAMLCLLWYTMLCLILYDIDVTWLDIDINIDIEIDIDMTWWCHQMETFSALLAYCAIC